MSITLFGKSMKYGYICKNNKRYGLHYFKRQQVTSKLKATVHTSGKLGFTEVTARELGFKEDAENFVQFAQDDENQDILYLINDAIDDGDSFRINKAGKYFYVNTKLLFDSLGVDYINNTVIFDMVKIKIGDKELYKMISRVIKKSKQEAE